MATISEQWGTNHYSRKFLSFYAQFFKGLRIVEDTLKDAVHLFPAIHCPTKNPINTIVIIWVIAVIDAVPLHQFLKTKFKSEAK
jgi:hypothetical protein